jgi:hypothetical protein
VIVSLVIGSSIRIGTLHEFRAMEDSDPRRGDREEGIYAHCEYIGDGTQRQDRGLSPRTARVLGVAADSGVTVQPVDRIDRKALSYREPMALTSGSQILLDRATAIGARTCPHIKYRGHIEVRRFIQ